VRLGRYGVRSARNNSRQASDEQMPRQSSSFLTSSTIRFVPKEERSRDNSFLDKDRHHWKGIALIVVLGLITVALVVFAILG
jgi:hypothetical protein